jgi:hypothetical protein
MGSEWTTEAEAKWALVSPFEHGKSVPFLSCPSGDKGRIGDVRNSSTPDFTEAQGWGVLGGGPSQGSHFPTSP